MTRTSGTTAASDRGERVAIVAGLRTPFTKRGTGLAALSARQLACLVVRELCERTAIERRDVGLVVYGQAVPNAAAANIAREIVLACALDASIDAFTVVRACATSFQAVTSAAEAILAGQHDVAIAGGADSASDAPFTVSSKLGAALGARGLAETLHALTELSARDLLPVQPALREPSTGLSMGEHAEQMAKEAGVSRAEQDRFAHRSHQRAGAAWERGVLDAEVMHVLPPPDFDRSITHDNLVNRSASVEALAKLDPMFDRSHGTVTAGNSFPLADGASALLLMREAKAKALGYEPLGYLRSWAYAALDPRDGLLMGPAYASPIALDRAGLRLRDMDLVEMHEAFAAQVICNTRAFASRRFAETELGRTQGPLGEIDEDRLNVHGGSIALGHPFAATGARMMLTMLRELQRRRGQFGLVTSSAAGGLGASIVLEMA